MQFHTPDIRPQIPTFELNQLLRWGSYTSEKISLPSRKTGMASMRFYSWFNPFSLALNLIGSKPQDVRSGLTEYAILHQSKLIQSPQVIPFGSNIHWRLQFLAL